MHLYLFRKKVITSFVALLSLLTIATAQKPKKPTSGELYHKIERLGFLGSALYVAAHADDDNTRLISYLANETKAYTTYLSLTR